MKNSKFLVATFLLCGFGASRVKAQSVTQTVAPSAAVDPKGTPQQQIESSLRQFVSVLADANFIQAQNYVVNPRFGFFGSNEWLNAWHDIYYPRQITLDGVQIERLDGEHTTVKVSYHFGDIQGYAGPPAEKYQESLHLRLSTQDMPTGVATKDWRIVVGPSAEVWRKDATSLERVALALKQNSDLAEDLRAQVAVWRLQKLEVALLQLRQDYSSYAFQSGYFETALRAYMLPGKDDPFLIPGTKEKWAFNVRLSGQPEPWADEPRVVLLYDGANEKLNYRFDGKAAVCPDDGFGTVTFVTPAQAATLRFQPAPKVHLPN